MLKISAAKVAHAIARAREHDAASGSWESQMQQIFHDESGETILDAFTTAYTRGTLAELIESLNADERASLLVIAWIGQGAITADEVPASLEKARTEQVYLSGDYLVGIPLLAEYLCDGLGKLGYPIPDREDKQRLQ
jgi:hypothetical protein